MLTLIVTELRNAIVQTSNLSDFYEDYAVNLAVTRLLSWSVR